MPKVTDASEEFEEILEEVASGRKLQPADVECLLQARGKEVLASRQESG